MTAPKTKEFKNGTKENIFTEKGRVGSGDTVVLTADQAKAYKGLVACKTK